MTPALPERDVVHGMVWSWPWLNRTLIPNDTTTSVATPRYIFTINFLCFVSRDGGVLPNPSTCVHIDSPPEPFSSMLHLLHLCYCITLPIRLLVGPPRFTFQASSLASIVCGHRYDS